MNNKKSVFLQTGCGTKQAPRLTVAVPVADLLWSEEDQGDDCEREEENPASAAIHLGNMPCNVISEFDEAVLVRWWRLRFGRCQLNGFDGERTPEWLFHSLLDILSCSIVTIIFTFITAALTEFSNDSIRCVLLDDIWRVDHVKLSAGILACERQDRKLTTRVLAKEICHVQDPVVQDHPAVSLGDVFLHLSHGEPTTTTTFFLGWGGLLAPSWSRRSSSRCGSLVHAVFVGTSGKFGTLNLA